MDVKTSHQCFRQRLQAVVQELRANAPHNLLVRCYDSEDEFRKHFPTRGEREDLVTCLDSCSEAIAELKPDFPRLVLEGPTYLEEEDLRYEFLDPNSDNPVTREVDDDSL